MVPSNPPLTRAANHPRPKDSTQTQDIESLYKIDAAMAIAQAELGNSIISCREVLDERRTLDMTAKQREVFDETVRLINSAPQDVSPGRLSQLDTEPSSHIGQETPIDSANHLRRAQSIEDILHKSQRYLNLKKELSALRAWWATATVKYKSELAKCSRASIEIDQRLKEISVLEKAAGRIETEAERTAEAEARVLIRRVKRMKTDLYNSLENFTATKTYMSSVQEQFKAIRDTMRGMEGRIKQPPPYDASQRPRDFNYDYHLPEKRAVDTQWWISKGFTWWANLAYSHLVQTSVNLEEAILKCQSRQARPKDEVFRLVQQIKEINKRRDEHIEFIQGFDTQKHIWHNIMVRNEYFQAKREIGTADDQLTEVRGRLSAYELRLTKLRFTESIHELMISLHTAVRNILGYALVDDQLQTGIYNELSLEYVHAIVCLARKSMRAAVDIMTDIDSDSFTMEDMDYIEGVSHEQGEEKQNRDKRGDLRKLQNAGIVFLTVQQRNDLLEDALDASLSENQKILWLAKIVNGLRNDRKVALSKGSLHQCSGSVEAKKAAEDILRVEGGLKSINLSVKYTPSIPSRDVRESPILVEISQMLADFFRSPDISHHFRPDGWVFEIHDLFRLVELAIEDPPNAEEFVYFLEHCNVIEELFDTNFRTQKVRKQKVGWELIDEASIEGAKRIESIWDVPADFDEATDFMIANGSDLHSDINRNITIESFRAKWNNLAADQVSKETFQSYVDVWHGRGTFIVALREERDGLLLRFIDNGWLHLKDFPNIILPYPPITFIPSCWPEVWKLIMEPQVASIWKPKVRSGKVRTVPAFYIEVREAIEKVNEVVGSGFWELWVPKFIKGKKIQLTLYKFWLFLRTMANVPGPIIILDRKGQKIHGNRLYDNEVTNRLSAQRGL